MLARPAKNWHVGCAYHYSYREVGKARALAVLQHSPVFAMTVVILYLLAI